jgi:uncharacterized protein (DUF952 family)
VKGNFIYCHIDMTEKWMEGKSNGGIGLPDYDREIGFIHR